MKKVFVGLAVLVSLGLAASQALAWSPSYGANPLVFSQEKEGEV